MPGKSLHSTQTSPKLLISIIMLMLINLLQHNGIVRYLNKQTYVIYFSLCTHHTDTIHPPPLVHTYPHPRAPPYAHILQPPPPRTQTTPSHTNYPLAPTYPPSPHAHILPPS